jgi:hypothetical protein
MSHSSYLEQFNESFSPLGWLQPVRGELVDSANLAQLRLEIVDRFGDC